MGKNKNDLNSKSVTINTMLNTFRMTLTIIVPLITYPYITRIFGASGIGQYEWVKSVVSIFTLIASLGITTYAIRDGSKIRTNRSQFSKFAHELFIINLISTVICYILLFLLILGVDKFNQCWLMLAVYGINIGMSALSLDWVYSVYEDYFYITVRQIIVQVISVCGLFLLVKDENDILIYVVITTVSNSGANIFNFIHSRKYVDFKPQGHYDILHHLYPVIVFFGTRFAMNAYNSLDTFVLGMLSTNEAVGYYNVAVKINTILVTFFTAMSPVYYPRMITYISSGEMDKYDLLLEKAIKLKTLLIYPIVAGLFCYASEIIWIIAGDGFLQAISTMRILCFVLAFVLLSSIVQKDFLITHGYEKIVLYLTLGCATLNVLISSVLIILIGFNGAAIGSLIAEGLAFCVGVAIVCKQGTNLLQMIIKESVHYIIAAIVMLAVCVIIKMVLSSTLLVLVVGISMGIATYFTMLLIMRDDFCLSSVNIVINKLRSSLKK